MKSGMHAKLDAHSTDSRLQVYLLGSVGFDAALTLQRLLAYQVAGDRSQAALVLCEHPPLVSVGRQGSRSHILYEPEELKVRGWPVRWVNRGGGTLLHVPGQLAIYPIVPLERWGRDVPAYLDFLHATIDLLLQTFSVRAEPRGGRAGVWVHGRPIGAIGVAVRHWVAYYGAYLNVSADLALLRGVRFGGLSAEPMTSLERERHGPLRPTLVREWLVDRFTQELGFSEAALFFQHPILRRESTSIALPTG